MKLHVAIALGLLAGLALGLSAAATELPLLMAVATGVEPIGTAFVNILRMVVIPLVAAVIFVGVASLGDLLKLGRMGIATLGFFAITSVIGVLFGMGVMKLLLPLASEEAASAITVGPVETAPMPGPVEFLIGLIPSNPFQAAADGALLPLIVFVVLFAAAAGVLPREDRDRLLNLAEAVASALIKLVNWILWVAPLGVFSLAAPVTARSGWAMLQSLAAFVLAVVVGLVLFVFLVYLPTIQFIARFPVDRFLRSCLTAQAIAAASTSSPATVPAMLETAGKNLSIANPVSGFVIPLGAGIGRAGSAVFQGAGIMFLAWLFDVSLVAAGIGAAVFATVIVSFTVPSVPGGSVLSMAPAMTATGIPLDGIGILLGVDRVPDMARTATNVTGTLTTAVVVDRLEERWSPDTTENPDR